MRELFLVGILFWGSVCSGETGYRIVHPDGTVEFTDQPANGAEEISLPEVSTYPAPSPPAARLENKAPPAPSPVQQQEGYSLFTFSSPQDQETVWFDEAGMSVSLGIEPGLAEGDEVVIRLDGEVVASGTATTYLIQDVFRGTHTLTAAITDSQGSLILETGPVTFTLRQHSAQHRKP